MAEPTTVNYPSSYEDNTTLLGPVEERETVVVKTSISVADIQITFNEPLPNLVGPLVLLFEGGEIWWVEADGIMISEGNTIISLDSLNQRAYHNSILQPHTAGEEAYFTVASPHINQYKKGIEALQQNGFLLGTAAEKTAYESSAVAGEGWLESDTGKVYYCFVAGTFVWVNYLSHSDLAGLSDDDHDTGASAYHTDARATTWHGLESGVHIEGGDDHDHFSADEGSAVLRVHGGLDASKGSPSYPGQHYFATDTVEGGTLYISADGIAWDKISGAPEGAIAAYEGACPSGWSRYTNLDGKYLYVDNTAPGSSGGANTHQHDYSTIREHYHEMDSPGTSGQTNTGNHSHQWRHYTGSGGSSRRAQTNITTAKLTVTAQGGFSHAASIPATVSSQTGVASPQTSVDSNEPPYKELVFCEKD
jgi:hypothetical protein